MEMTWSEREGLDCCPCVECDNNDCNPRGFCINHNAWLEGRKMAMRKELERLDRLSRSYIEGVKNR